MAEDDLTPVRFSLSGRSKRLPAHLMGTAVAETVGACVWPGCRLLCGMRLTVLSVAVGPLCDEHRGPIERDVSAFWMNAREWTPAETTARLALLDRERAAMQARHDEALRCAEETYDRG